MTGDGRGAPAPLRTGLLGMKIFILALSMLFGASIFGYLVIRSRAPVWPPPGVPPLPATLWISTLIIAVSSATMEGALRAARRGAQGALRAGMLLTTLLGAGFLVSQTLNWFSLVAADLTAKTNLYGFTFYMLTGLHAAHVLGGLVPLVVVTLRAFRGRYTESAHEGVAYTAVYWHFLAVVWVVLYAILMLAS